MKFGQIKFNEIKQSIRFNSSYHLSEAVRYESLIKRKSYGFLKDLTEDIFCAGRVKRVYVTKEFGTPFLGNTDVESQFPITNCKYISNKFFNDNKSFLKEGMILTGRVGQNTVGSFHFANKDVEKCIGSDNVIRIIANKRVRNGYLYSFLASKYGNKLSRRHISGNAQPFITEDMLSSIPIALIDEKKQLQAHNLILESANLRSEAYAIICESEKKFITNNEIELDPALLEQSENKLSVGFIVKSSESFKSTIKARNYSKRALKIIENWELKPGKKLKNYLVEPMEMGARASFKRITSINFEGEDLISQGDIHKRNPKNFKQVKVKKMSPSDLAQRSSLIMPCAGTLGESEIFTKPLLVRNNFEGKLLSEVIGKFKCENEIDAAYLYIVLSSEPGFRILRAKVYGTNLLYPRWDLLKNINIPIINESLKNEIGMSVLNAFDKLSLATKKENEAINLVEKEIEEWEK